MNGSTCTTPPPGARSLSLRGHDARASRPSPSPGMAGASPRRTSAGTCGCGSPPRARGAASEPRDEGVATRVLTGRRAPAPPRARRRGAAVGGGHGRPSPAGHEDAVHHRGLLPEGPSPRHGRRDHLVFWDLDSGRSHPRTRASGGVLEVRYSPRGDVVASRNQKDGRVMLWDGRTGAPRSGLRGMRAMCWASPSRSTGRAWPRRASTRPCGCGTWPPERAARCGPHRAGERRGLLPERKGAGLHQPGRHGPPVAG